MCFESLNELSFLRFPDSSLMKITVLSEQGTLENNKLKIYDIVALFHVASRSSRLHCIISNSYVVNITHDNKLTSESFEFELNHFF